MWPAGATTTERPRGRFHRPQPLDERTTEEHQRVARRQQELHAEVDREAERDAPPEPQHEFGHGLRIRHRQEVRQHHGHGRRHADRASEGAEDDDASYVESRRGKQEDEDEPPRGLQGDLPCEQSEHEAKGDAEEAES